MRAALMIFDKFPPHNLSGSHRPFHFAKHLPEHGYAPYVISGFPEPGEPVDRTPLSELAAECGVVQVERLTHAYGSQLASVRALLARGAPASAAQAAPAPTQAAGRRPSALAERIARAKLVAYRTVNWPLWFHVDWALPVLREATRAAQERPFDIIWASGPSGRNLFAAYLVSLHMRRPLVVDIRDPWTYGSIWQPVAPGAGAIETFWAHRILDHAARVVFTSPLTQGQMGERFPRATARMCTITNGFAETTEQPTALRGVPREKLLLSYVGSLNARRRPDVLLGALQRLQRDPVLARDVRLQFVGGLGEHASRPRDFGVEDAVVDVGRVNQRDSVRYMHGADVNVLLQTITEGQDVIAGKTYEYLAARKPILAVVSPQGGDAWLLRDTGAGGIVPFDEPARVATAIEALHARWRAGTLPPGLDEVQLSRFSRATLTGELATVFDESLPAA